MPFPKAPRVLVTGAGSGLGRAISVSLARRGARVVGTDLDESLLEETGGQVRSAGGVWYGTVADVGRWADWKRLESSVSDRMGGLDILVNNAGVAVLGRIGEVPIEDWLWQLDVNLRGVIYGCHLFVPGMRRQRSGFILNVASAAGFASAPEMGPYSVSKAAVISLTETMGAELKTEGITATVLCPTFFRSQLSQRTRVTSDRLQRMSKKLIDGAQWTAERVAMDALSGLESGRLYVIPQPDARAIYRLKRALGPRFVGFLQWYRRRGSGR
ncbi:MAG: SDR family NAD(P)-dependent oxidoreductase [Myxococcota bacterium]